MWQIRKIATTEKNKNKTKDILRNNLIYKMKREIIAGMEVKS